MDCPIINAFSHTLNTMHLAGEGPLGAACSHLVGAGERLGHGLLGSTCGTVFLRGTTLWLSPDPAVSETWAALGLVGRDPGLCPCMPGLAQELGAMLDGALLWGHVPQATCWGACCAWWRGIWGLSGWEGRAQLLKGQMKTVAEAQNTLACRNKVGKAKGLPSNTWEADKITIAPAGAAACSRPAAASGHPSRASSCAAGDVQAPSLDACSQL